MSPADFNGGSTGAGPLQLSLSLGQTSVGLGVTGIVLVVADDAGEAASCSATTTCASGPIASGLLGCGAGAVVKS